MKRWIIRSFFIGLLLLCVSGWITSILHDWDIEYRGKDFWVAGGYSGGIELTWYADRGPLFLDHHGWAFNSSPRGPTPLPLLFGFFVMIGRDEVNIRFPVWLPVSFCR